MALPDQASDAFWNHRHPGHSTPYRTGSEDRPRLDAIVGNRNSAQKHVARAQALIATGEGFGTNEVMRRSGLSKPAVWRWQERFMREGVDGLLRDKTRKPGKAPLPSETVARVVGLTLGDPPGLSGISCVGRVG